MVKRASSNETALHFIPMKSGAAVKIKVADLLSVLDLIRAHRRHKQLTTAFNQSGAKVSIEAEFVNTIKTVVASHTKMRETALGKKVLFPVERKALPEGGTEQIAASDPYNTCCGFSSDG